MSSERFTVTHCSTCGKGVITAPGLSEWCGRCGTPVQPPDPSALDRIRDLLREYEGIRPADEALPEALEDRLVELRSRRRSQRDMSKVRAALQQALDVIDGRES